MRFLNPGFAWLLLVVVAAVLAKYYIAVKNKKGGVKYPLTSVVAMTAKPSWRIRLMPLPDILRFLVLVLLVAGLMRPQKGIEYETSEKIGLDIMIALDVSGSMRAEDFKPNRIEAAKEITETFIRNLQEHRIGLVLFSGIALTQCPLTMDYGVVTELLRRSRVGSIRADGTAIGEAIVNAVYKLGEVKDSRDRVIVLLSDGVNNSGVDPLTAARVAKERNVKIYTIGVGSEEGAAVPYYQDGQKYYARDFWGNVGKTLLDEQALQDVAYITGGQYFRATDNQALEDIYTEIAQLETGKLEVRKTINFAERFNIFLIPALVLLFIEFILRNFVFQRIF